MKQNKNVVRLTESQFKQMISESVREALNEISWKTYANAASAASDRENIFKQSPTYPYPDYPEGPKSPDFYKNYKKNAERAYRQSKQPEKFKKAAYAALSREICGEDNFWKYVLSRINNGDVGEDLAKKIKQYQEGEKYIRNNNTKWSVRSLRNESRIHQIVAESVKRVLSEMQNDDFSIICLNYLEQNEYSKESISKVANLMFKNDQWTLYDGRHELLALATDQNDKLMYSFNQKAWQYVN